MRSQNFRGNVFVANLPPEISDEQLAEAFDAFGIVLSATVAHDPATGKRLRYGFVDIATERAAKLAVESMNGAAIDGYNLDVRISERPVTAKNRVPPPGPPVRRRAGLCRGPATMAARGRAPSLRARNREGSPHFRWSAVRCRAGPASPAPATVFSLASAIGWTSLSARNGRSLPELSQRIP